MEDGIMYKNIYRNPKTGKFYAFLEGARKSEFKILPVFLPHENIWLSAEAKIDKLGKTYRTLQVELFTLKNGFDAFRYYDPKNEKVEQEVKTTKNGPIPHFDNGGLEPKAANNDGS